MNQTNPRCRVTICVLTYGNYANLVRQCVDSIRQHCKRSAYRLYVGANSPGRETTNYLNGLYDRGDIDRLFVSTTNINKCPMMRRMFEKIQTEFIWWFDDDSYIEDPKALPERLEIAAKAKPSSVLWGHMFFFGNELDFSYGTDVVGFVKRAPWYRGKEPPSWKPGGKGEFNFQNWQQGDGRWFFITGGCWLIRTSAVRALDWPDPNLIKRNDDVFLAEAIRQHGWEMKDIGPLGVAINTQPRRGEGEDKATMQQQIKENCSTSIATPDFSFPQADHYRRLVSEFRNGTIVQLGLTRNSPIFAIFDICRQNNNRIAVVKADEKKLIGNLNASENVSVEEFRSELAKRRQLSALDVYQKAPGEAAASFDDASVDQIWIEPDYLAAADMQSVRSWLKKLKPGGCVAGRLHRKSEQCKSVVLELCGDQVQYFDNDIWKFTPTNGATGNPGRGCVFITTYEDTDLLLENFGGRSQLTNGIDYIVYDDNFKADEISRVRAACERNNWIYRKSPRGKHGTFGEEVNDRSSFNHFIWDTLTTLGCEYDYVIKMDTDAYPIDPTWYHEMARILYGSRKIAGTPEHRPTKDVMSFWELAGKAGYSFELKKHIMHVQGGIYGISRRALIDLREMGFLDGRHVFFGEDCYMSYCCRLLEVEFQKTSTIGSWWRPYRPKLDRISYKKAIHPLSRSEWEEFLILHGSRAR